MESYGAMYAELRRRFRAQILAENKTTIFYVQLSISGRDFDIYIFIEEDEKKYAKVNHYEDEEAPIEDFYILDNSVRICFKLTRK